MTDYKHMPMPWTSKSKIVSYDYCPYSWWLQFVKKERGKQKKSAIEGTNMHMVFAKFYDQVQQKHVFKDEFIDYTTDVRRHPFRRFVYEACYDKDTEILTKNDGWILFKDLTKDHKVACLSQDDHIMYWHKPSAIQKYHYEGEMYKINHKQINLLITPDHNFYTKKSCEDEYRFVEAQYLKCIQQIPNTQNWEGKEKKWFYFPEKNTHHNQIVKKKLLMDDWLKFLGWYISEGWTTFGNGQYTIGISQQKQENIQEIAELLERLGYKFKYNGKYFKFSNKQLYTYLSDLGKAKDKHIPQEFMNLSKRQLQILFDALMKGDGSICKKEERYITISEKLKDQLQEIIIKLGYDSSVYSFMPKKHRFENKIIKSKNRCYVLRVQKRKQHTIKYKHRSKEYYSGMVYDCTVPEHIILVRRNDKCVWCGNCMRFVKPNQRDYGKYKNIISNFATIETQRWLRLNRLLSNKKKIFEYFKPLYLEKRLEYEPLKLFGTIDRVNAMVLNNGEVKLGIFDYKTGNVPSEVMDHTSDSLDMFDWTLPTSKMKEIHFYGLLYSLMSGYTVKDEIREFLNDPRWWYITKGDMNFKETFTHKKRYLTSLGDKYKLYKDGEVMEHGDIVLGYYFLNGAKKKGNHYVPVSYKPIKKFNYVSLKGVYLAINKVRSIWYNKYYLKKPLPRDVCKYKNCARWSKCEEERQKND